MRRWALPVLIGGPGHGHAAPKGWDGPVEVGALSEIRYVDMDERSSTTDAPPRMFYYPKLWGGRAGYVDFLAYEGLTYEEEGRLVWAYLMEQAGATER